MQGEIYSRRVGIGRGAAWLGEGWRLFRREPGLWIAVVLIWLAIMAALSFLPLGGLVTALASPVLTGGLMMGCAALAGGRRLQVEHLFAGLFEGRLGPLLGLGAFSLGANLLVLVGMVVLVLLWFPNLRVYLEALAAGQGAPLPAFGWHQPALVALIALALLVPVAMALWFAPALAALRGLGTMAALRASFVGCLRNALPLLLYGLLLVPLTVLAALPLLLGFLVLVPVLVASVYAGYRDIYAPDPPPAGNERA